eukprot:455427-Rhodomonas_salina.1
MQTRDTGTHLMLTTDTHNRCRQQQLTRRGVRGPTCLRACLRACYAMSATDLRRATLSGSRSKWRCFRMGLMRA